MDIRFGAFWGGKIRGGRASPPPTYPVCKMGGGGGVAGGIDGDRGGDGDGEGDGDGGDIDAGIVTGL